MRDYIYLGDRLLAEYQPQTGQIYYYTSDQVNSTRVVTDQNGVRVFATKSFQAQMLAHESYGHAWLYIQGLPYLPEPGSQGSLNAKGKILTRASRLWIVSKSELYWRLDSNCAS